MQRNIFSTLSRGKFAYALHLAYNKWCEYKSYRKGMCKWVWQIMKKICALCTWNNNSPTSMCLKKYKIYYFLASFVQFPINIKYDFCTFNLNFRFKYFHTCMRFYDITILNDNQASRLCKISNLYIFVEFCMRMHN